MNSRSFGVHQWCIILVGYYVVRAGFEQFSLYGIFAARRHRHNTWVIEEGTVQRPHRRDFDGTVEWRDASCVIQLTHDLINLIVHVIDDASSVVLPRVSYSQVDEEKRCAHILISRCGRTSDIAVSIRNLKMVEERPPPSFASNGIVYDSIYDGGIWIHFGNILI